MIPNFYTKVTKGTIEVYFQTTTHKCTLRFQNETFSILIDDKIVFTTAS
jgi:hypothetical protein